MEINIGQKVIPIWLVVYDRDPSKSYILCSQDKVYASLDGAIRTAFQGANEEAADQICDDLIAQLRLIKPQSFMIVRCPNLSIVVHRLELDRHNQICKVLFGCLDQVDEDTRDQIDRLFVEQV